MTENEIKTEEGATLWRRVSKARDPARAGQAPDPLVLAAWLDGTLEEEDAAGLEAQLAADPALLGDLLALRESLDAVPGPVPASVVTRARALRPEQEESPRPEQEESLRPARQAAKRPAQRRPAQVQAGLLDRLFGVWLRPAVPVFAALAILVACVGAFELGRYQGAQLEAEEVATSSESDVPVDLLLAGLL